MCSKADAKFENREWGVHFVYNPGTAETLNMHDEGETLGLLTKKTNKGLTLVAHVRWNTAVNTAALRTNILHAHTK